MKKCPICSKLYETNSATKADKVCPHCELESITNPAIRYYIAGKEITREEYNRFINGEIDETNI